MRISLITFSISSLVVVPLLPTSLAKALVPLVYLLLIFDLSRTTLTISNIQYVLVLLLIPAFFNLLVVEPLNIVRLFPLAYLILTSGTLRPFKRFTHVSRIIYYLILFIAISSFFLAIGNPIATGFRETFYPMDDSSFNYGVLDSFSLSFGAFRFGGLWKNPNVTSSIVFLLTLISYAIHLLNLPRTSTLTDSFLSFCSSNKLMLSSALFYIYLSGNRTYLLSLLVFVCFLFIIQLLTLISKLRIKSSLFLPLFLLLAGIVLVFCFWKRTASSVF